MLHLTLKGHGCHQILQFKSIAKLLVQMEKKKENKDSFVT